MADEQDRSFIGEAVENAGCAAIAGCLWLVAALWLLPGIWIGLGYGYTLSEWLSLLPYPAESDEVLPWLGNIIPLVVLVFSTLFLVVFGLRRGSPPDEG